MIENIKNMKKNISNNKDIWEKIFLYPSFNLRFGIIFFLTTLIFIVIVSYILLNGDIIDKISLLNLLVQFTTLSVGVFAVYYALRQLIETRFIKLDEVAMQELKDRSYYRAYRKWKEAFYIKPEVNVFNNMCEAILLASEFALFDEYIKITEKKDLFFNKDIFEDLSDKILILYLRTIRYLLVKNQGESEEYINKIVDIVKKEESLTLAWDFMDLQNSKVYMNLDGECKNIINNLISYLSNNMQKEKRDDFESGNFATKVGDQKEVINVL